MAMVGERGISMVVKEAFMIMSDKDTHDGGEG